MNTLIPGAPLRSLSPTSNEYQRAEGVSRAAKPARVARFTLDAPEHSGTIPGARGDILTPGVALTSNLAVIFTLNQHTGTSFWTVWTSPAYGGSGSRLLGLLRQARSRVSSCAAFSCTNASARPMAGFRPQPGAALAAMANGTPGNGAAAPAGSVSAGTHLVREWNGRTYQVEVLDNGYRFDGKTYPSLTAITKRITGTHWSGPRFFGLAPKRKA